MGVGGEEIEVFSHGGKCAEGLDRIDAKEDVAVPQGFADNIKLDAPARNEVTRRQRDEFRLLIDLAGDIDCAATLLELEGGVPAVIDLSRNARYADDMRTEILVPDGAIFIDTVPDGHTRVGTRRGRNVIDESLVTDGFLDGVARQLAAFATAVDDRMLQFPDAFASSRAMRAAIAANQAGATGRWVSVQEVSAFQPPTALFN